MSRKSLAFIAFIGFLKSTYSQSEFISKGFRLALLIEKGLRIF